MCGGGGSAPSQPTVDPEAERRKAEREAAAKANNQLLSDARRKRAQRGLLATGDDGATVLGSASSDAPGNHWTGLKRPPSPGSGILGNALASAVNAAAKG